MPRTGSPPSEHLTCSTQWAPVCHCTRLRLGILSCEMKRSNVYCVLSPAAQKLPAVAGLGEGKSSSLFSGFFYYWQERWEWVRNYPVCYWLCRYLLVPLKSLTLAVFLFKRCDVLWGPYGFILVPVAVYSCGAPSLRVLKSMTRLLWLESPFNICLGVGGGHSKTYVQDLMVHRMNSYYWALASCFQALCYFNFWQQRVFG